MAYEFGNPWTTLSQRKVYENEWFSVREDRVRRPDGAEGVYGVVELPPSVGVVSMDDAAKVLLVGQWRYCLRRYAWEIPMGFCELGEQPLAAAVRELEEEAGIRASAWRSLGSIDNSSAVSTDSASLFLATGLTYVASHPDPTEKIRCSWISFEDCLEMAMDGRISDSTSVVAVLRTDRLLHAR
jgi:ADP-ribose pyrophosphatase